MASNIRIYDPDRFNIRSLLSRIHPCCGFSLETASSIIAIIHMTFSGVLAGLLVFCISVIMIVHDDQAKAKFEEGSVEYWKYKLGMKYLILILVIMALLVTLYFVLSLSLYRGVKARNFRKVNRWWKIMLGITIIFVLHNVIALFQFKSELTIGVWEILDIIFDVYSLWVVYEFKLELQQPSESTVEFDRVLHIP